jgi:hypothetical protein
VHIKHKWSPWHRLIDLSDAEALKRFFIDYIEAYGWKAAKFELKDIDQRICAKCGKRQQREVKP